MKKIIIYILFVSISARLFSDDLLIAKQYIIDNNLLSDYIIMDLHLKKDKTNTYLFYKPYNNNKKQYLYNDTISFTDAVLIKVTNNNIIQFLYIYQNGLVKTNNNIVFFDFSESEYSHVKFNGWLFNLRNQNFYDINVNIINLQLTNDGINTIPADPALPNIFWDYFVNYPFKYEYTMYPLPRAIWLMGYEWREDLKISCARTGLRDMDMTFYLDTLSPYDKRVIINAMFAMNGYEFKTAEWTNYFRKFFWYKPDNIIKNDVNILDQYQLKLFEYLSR